MEAWRDPALCYTLEGMRATALILLLFIAIDLGSACVCEDGPIDAGGSTAHSIAALASSNGSGDTDLSHECFCCCRHIQPEKIVRVNVELPLVEVVENGQPQGLNAPPAPLYHPPRLIAL